MTNPKNPRGAGRKPRAGKTTIVPVRLTEQERSIAYDIGDKNVSAGIRTALLAYWQALSNSVA